MKKFLKITAIISLILFIGLGTFAFIFIGNIMKESKNISLSKEKLFSNSAQMQIYDNNNQLISSTSAKGKSIALISEIPNDTINAFISIEDKNFYKHKGLNYKRIAKAMLNNITSFSFKEGGSTISQQLIKNTHLSNEKTIKRKILEMILTKKLEKQYDKNSIMEAYLNNIYFGDGCYGISEASNYYFGKNVSQLTVPESAMLAGVIKSPSKYSPIHNYDNCIGRRNIVLTEMFEDGYIEKLDYDKYIVSPIELNLDIKTNNTNALYLQQVISEACNILKLNDNELALNGYILTTYYDNNAHNILINSIDNVTKPINSYNNTNDMLNVIINANSGGIVAMYDNSEYNLLNLKRQPGSTIKPIMVYAPALECNNIYNSSMILDEPINYNGYSPNNVGNTFSGYVSIRDAVAKSLNIPAVKIMNNIGIDNCKTLAKKCGIEFDKNDNGLALALGGFTNGTTLPQLVGSYLPFVKDGMYCDIGFIKQITTNDGIVLYKKDEIGTRVIGDDTAYLMTDLLIDSVKNGTSKKLSTLPFEIAGKTGTVAVPNTNYNSDAYSVAYTTEYIAGVWCGNYSNQREFYLESNNNGGTYASEILKDIFYNLHKDNPPNDFEIPSSITYFDIDTKALSEYHNVELATENCPDRYRKTEIFAARYSPDTNSNLFDEVDAPYLNVENFDNYSKITFDACDYYEYELYCNDKLLNSYKNNNTTVIFEHNNLEENTMYTYYVVVKCENKSTKSKQISIITKNNNDIILDNTAKNNDLSWFFN